MSIQFTQGDTALLNLTITDGDGNPFDISLATFESRIKGLNGATVVTFPDSQHTILDGPNGRLTLALSAADTAKCGLGPNKTIITQVTQGASIIQFRGTGILTVNSPAPSQ